MRRNYKYLYHAAPIPIVRPTVHYDPLRTYMERRATASRLARRRAKRRITRTIAFWIELIVPSILVLVMLPVLWVVGLIMLAGAFWQRYVRGCGRQRTRDDLSRSYAGRSAWASSVRRAWRPDHAPCRRGVNETRMAPRERELHEPVRRRRARRMRCRRSLASASRTVCPGAQDVRTGSPRSLMLVQPLLHSLVAGA